MRDSDAFHPDLRRMALVLPRSIFTRQTIPLIRAVTRAAARRTPQGVDVRAISPDVTVRLHRPPMAPQVPGPALLWIHGGGYVVGSAAQDDALCRRFARRLGMPVAAVDYRLAPKNPYPCALEDCYAALAWLARRPDVDASRIAIGGASAGGGLAAALALLARDRDGAKPAFQLLVYPMLDDRSSALPDDRRYRLWTPKTNRLGWSAYLGGADPDQVVPARRADLHGLAPAWVGVGCLDPLHDEGVVYVERLTDSGVPCQLHTVAGAFHGFDAVAPAAGVSQDFFERQCRAVQSALTFSS